MKFDEKYFEEMFDKLIPCVGKFCNDWDAQGAKDGRAILHQIAQDATEEQSRMDRQAVNNSPAYGLLNFGEKDKRSGDAISRPITIDAIRAAALSIPQGE